MDYKFGQEPVTPAERNFQLQCYVLGAFQKFPKLERIVGVLICPNQWAATDEGDQAKGIISMHEYTRSDILELASRVLATLERCNDPNKQPTTNEKACRFCSRKANCPALKEIAMEIARKYTGLPLPSEFDPDRMVSPRDRVIAQVLVTQEYQNRGSARQAAVAPVVRTEMDVLQPAYVGGGIEPDPGLQR